MSEKWHISTKRKCNVSVCHLYMFGPFLDPHAEYYVRIYCADVETPFCPFGSDLMSAEGEELALAGCC